MVDLVNADCFNSRPGLLGKMEGSPVVFGQQRPNKSQLPILGGVSKKMSRAWDEFWGNRWKIPSYSDNTEISLYPLVN